MSEIVTREPLVGLEDVGEIGRDLNRPECVLCTADGTLYASRRAGGVVEIRPDGQQRLIGQEGQTANGEELIPNGIARLPDGTFLLANIGEGGGVWRLSAEGELSPHLEEVDGYPLSAANFVTVDGEGRTWITVSTVSRPRFKAYSDAVADGLVILQDERGARVVSDDIAFANECRVGPDGGSLYVSETFGRRVTRFELSASGELSRREAFCEFGRGDFPDGCRFHPSGDLWLTCIVSNRVYAISPGGEARLVLEDCDQAHVEWVERDLAAARMGREHFYTAGGRMLANVASVEFDPRGSKAFLGSLCGRSIKTFAIPPSLQEQR